MLGDMEVRGGVTPGNESRANQKVKYYSSSSSNNKQKHAPIKFILHFLEIR